MRKFFLALLNLFYPKTCLNCSCDIDFDAPRNLCEACFGSIRLVDGLICKICGMMLPEGGATCHICKKHDRAFKVARGAVVYEGAVRQMIHSLKYQEQDGLALELSFWLAHVWLKNSELLSADYIVPVALHSTRERERGYNQSFLLAKHFAWRIAHVANAPKLAPNILKRRKKTQSQMSLSRQERQTNIQDAFTVSNAQIIKNKTILLIDDVCTTGFTLDSCANALRQAGAKTVLALTLARD